MNLLNLTYFSKIIFFYVFKNFGTMINATTINSSNTMITLTDQNAVLYKGLVPVGGFAKGDGGGGGPRGSVEASSK